MAQTQVRERTRTRPDVSAVSARPKVPMQPVKVKRRKDTEQLKQQTRERLKEHEDDPRFQHELKEMEETHDLRDVDDDVEAEATLFEWYAQEHTHRPKSPIWFAILAASITVIAGLQLFFFSNIFGAITLAIGGGLVYYIAQIKPREVRYRIMVDGIAINNVLYHWRDLTSFNVLYEPDEVQTVIFLSDRRFSPYVHMEIGDADPVDIRDILLEFLPEDQEMEEPLVDIIARRLGF